MKMTWNLTVVFLLSSLLMVNCTFKPKIGARYCALNKNVKVGDVTVGEILTVNDVLGEVVKVDLRPAYVDDLVGALAATPQAQEISLEKFKLLVSEEFSASHCSKVEKQRAELRDKEAARAAGEKAETLRQEQAATLSRSQAIARFHAELERRGLKKDVVFCAAKGKVHNDVFWPSHIGFFKVADLKEGVLYAQAGDLEIPSYEIKAVEGREGSAEFTEADFSNARWRFMTGKEECLSYFKAERAKLEKAWSEFPLDKVFCYAMAVNDQGRTNRFYFMVHERPTEYGYFGMTGNGKDRGFFLSLRETILQTRLAFDLNSKKFVEENRGRFIAGFGDSIYELEFDSQKCMQHALLDAQKENTKKTF